ncbi:MAG: retropepsin-like aspartic protease, partial [Myxococcaceae bacterium]
PTLYVSAMVEEVPVAFVLDTGAESTFLSSDLAAGLLAGPALSGLRVSSGFAGVFSASATRARTVKVGQAAAQNVAVLSSPEVDAELSRLTEVAQTLARCDSNASCNPPPRLGGFLGWNYLREFRVSLSEGAPFGGRRLGLVRFDSQDHVHRDFVGIGILTTPSVDPPGLRVDEFLSVSPARIAGIRVGDVITFVDGLPVAQAPSPFGPIGAVVRFTLRRGSGTAEVFATVADLLPDPPPP